MNCSRIIISFVAALLFLCSTIAYAVPLSEEKVTTLIRAKVPDAVIAKEIQANGLGFKVSPQTLARIQAAGAGPITLNTLVGKFSKLQVAKIEIPKILSQVFSALDEGEPTRVEQYFGEFEDPAGVYSLIMNPFNYRGHYIERIVELPPTAIRNYNGYGVPATVKPGPSFFAVVRTLDKANKEYEQHIYFTVDVGRSGGPGLKISKVISPDISESILWGEAERNAAVNVARNFVFAIMAGDIPKADSFLWPEVNSTEIPGLYDCYQELQSCGSEWNSKIVNDFNSDPVRRHNGQKLIVTLTNEQNCERTLRRIIRAGVEKINNKMYIVNLYIEVFSVTLDPGMRACTALPEVEDPNELVRTENRYTKYSGRLVSDVKDTP